MKRLSILGIVAAIALAMLAANAEAAKFNLHNAAPAKSDADDNCVTDCIPIVFPVPVSGPVLNPVLADCPGPYRCAEVPTKPVYCVSILPCPVEPPVVQFPPLVNLPPAVRRTVALNAKYQGCGDQLAQLRRVTVGQVRRVHDGEAVHLVPLCDSARRSLTEQQLTYLSRGNVQGLVPAIDQNETLMAGLEDDGYEANDVIGIALAPGAAVLYVSRH